MPKLLRPHIPLETRCRVVLRQLGEMWPDAMILHWENGFGRLLANQLYALSELLECDPKDLNLDHDPPLGAREKVFDLETGEHVGYIPDANDPEHLIYREKSAHGIKTRVHGERGQRSDLSLIKRNRRIERGPIKRAKRKINSSGFKKIKRPLKSRSSWPKGRKIARKKK